MTDIRRIVSENRRVVWILAAALIINAALYVLLVYPLSQRVSSEQQQAGEATRQLVAARRAFESARGTVTGKKQADTELATFYRDVLPADLSGARRTMYPRLQQLAAAANLADFRLGFGQDNVTADKLRKLTATLNLTGDYTNIRRYLHDLETAPEFLVIESVSLTQDAEDEGNLMVTARVSTYYQRGANGN
jgi:Tfp pilus assembly protein PilO